MVSSSSEDIQVDPDIDYQSAEDFEYEIATASLTESDLVIDNNGNGDIIFNEAFSNVTAFMDISNQGGNIVTTNPDFYIEAGDVGDLVLQAEQGDIGASDQSLDLRLIHGKLMNDLTPSTMPAELVAAAGGNIYLDVVGINTTFAPFDDSEVVDAILLNLSAEQDIALVVSESILIPDDNVERSGLGVYPLINAVSTSGNLSVDIVAGDLFLGTDSSFTHLNTANQEVGEISALSGTMTLVASDAILDDEESSIDISANAAILQATTIAPLVTEISSLEVAIAEGDFILENTGALTIGGISDIDGIQTPGTIQITTFSPLTVTETLSATGDITLTATDSEVAGDDLTIAATAVITAAEGNILLQGGDDITIERNGTNPVIQAAGEVLIQGDYGNADPDVGSVMTISGEISAFSVTIQGDSDDDIVDASLISADLLIEGFAGDDYLASGSGVDTLIGGEGEDTLDGGDGIDIVTYKDSTTGVYANLSTGRGYRGESSGDRFVNIENLEGSEFSDILKGDNQVNLLLGLGGNDWLFGYGEDDTIDAGSGADIVRGGDGNDFIYGREGDDRILGDRGNDTMVGGLGDDFLRDVVGDNVYALSADDSEDKIVDFSRNNNAIALLDGLLSTEVDLVLLDSSTQIIFNNTVLARLLRTNLDAVQFVDLTLI